MTGRNGGTTPHSIADHQDVGSGPERNPWADEPDPTISTQFTYLKARTSILQAVQVLIGIAVLVSALIAPVVVVAAWRALL